VKNFPLFPLSVLILILYWSWAYHMGQYHTQPVTPPVTPPVTESRYQVGGYILVDPFKLDSLGHYKMVRLQKGTLISIPAPLDTTFLDPEPLISEELIKGN
jgi:hypothetical protein